MVSRWCAMTAVGLGLIGLGAPRAEAQLDPHSMRIDLFLQDADLYEATRVLTLQTGLEFVIEKHGDEEARPITLSIRDVSAEEAISYIVGASGANVEMDENGVFRIRVGEQDVEPEVTPTLLEKPKVVRRIRVMKADGQHILEMIKGAGPDTNRMMREMLNHRDDLLMRTMPRVPAQQLQIVGNDNAAVIDRGTLGMAGRSAPNGISLPGESANQLAGGGAGGFGGGAQGGFGGGQGGAFGGGQGGLGGGGGGGTDVQTLVDNSADNFVPDGIDRIIFDPITNDFIVSGDADAIAELRAIIEDFDKAPRQVVVRVEFVTTSESLDQARGIDWLYQRGTVFAGNRPGTFARASDPIFINFASGNVSARLRTLLQEGWGRTVSAPVVRTLNNQPAVVFSNVVTTIYVNNVTNGPGGIIVTPQPIQIPYNTSLAITPRINGDNTITMALAPTITDIGQVREPPTGVTGQAIPDQLTQGVNVVARVKNGETIALGGLTRKVDTYSESRFPILSELPLIGQLFRTRTAVQNTQELIIFVTPTIVDDDDLGLGGGV